MSGFSKKIPFALGCIFLIYGLFYYVTGNVTEQILYTYSERESRIIYDRHGSIIAVEPNKEGNYAKYAKTVPPRFLQLLTQTEDKYFYIHPGINPLSMARSLSRRFTGGSTASSTITQQLIKILKRNEFDRTSKNKILETLYAISLEMRLSKEEILNMYVNSVYLGNNVQGIEMASQLYFEKPAHQLTEQEMVRLISTLPSPSKSNPFEKPNKKTALSVAKKLDIDETSVPRIGRLEETYLRKKFNAKVTTPHYMELKNLVSYCEGSPRLSVDAPLSTSIREIAMRHIDALLNKDASHAAVVAINLANNEIIAIIGSPNPGLTLGGYQINMATQPRPIGSTIKPFIYTKGFENGLRPYTVVDDKEYKYTVNSGYAFYPKNYDYQYRGPVTLHYALSNSLNVPTVKVLENIGIGNFNNFLLNDLKFKPIQNIDEYQLGIALGGLEMDLLTLSYYFTLFPNNGNLKPLYLCDNKPIQSTNSQTDFNQVSSVFDSRYVELTQKIITDRYTGVEQFGAKNNLMIQGAVTAVKTGTSREFHDSWTIGYTPDFLVGVWVGNAENTPMNKVSGENGAGRIWNEVMQMLVYSEYNKNSEFKYDKIYEFDTENGIEYGLEGDDFSVKQNLMRENNLIITPYDNDTFQLQDNTTIPLKSSETVTWTIDGDDNFVQTGNNVDFKPSSPGQYTINARHEDGRLESITVYITQE